MAKKSGIEIDDKALNRQIAQAMRKAPEETVKAVKECLLDLAANSAKRAPIESGDLRNNCHADLNGVGVFASQQPMAGQPAGSLEAIGSVGYSLPYALRQHEELSYDHSRADGRKIMTGKSAGQTVNMISGGEAKFLERPFQERKDRYIKRVHQIVERSIPPK